MKLVRLGNLLWWAGRELARAPARSAVLAAALLAVALVVAVPLLLAQALTDTARQLLGAGPSLVVRKLDAGGWAPLPATEAERKARAVTGVVQARARIWGVVRAGDRPVTVVGVTDEWPEPALGRLSERPPKRGEVVVGPGLPSAGGSLVLTGAVSRTFAVVRQLPPETAMVAHDLVLAQADDARLLLGLPPGHASDLAVEVFHQQEEEAILPDLSQAFGWPVHLSRRSDVQGLYTAAAGRRGGLVVLAAVPALLALALLVAAQLREAGASRREIGLLKALGWTSRDVVTLRLLQALLTGLPATVIGLAAACLLVLWPGAEWPGAWLLGWTGPPPPLTLSGSGAALIVLEVAALVLAPYLAAVLLPVARLAATPPDALLDEG